LTNYQDEVEQFHGYRWPNAIMQEFYSILTRSESPTETEEEKFFGSKKSRMGGESFIEHVARKQDKYKSSKTPVWDLLRDNRSFFLPKGDSALNSLYISCLCRVDMITSIF